MQSVFNFNATHIFSVDLAGFRFKFCFIWFGEARRLFTMTATLWNSAAIPEKQKINLNEETNNKFIRYN